MKYKKGYKYQLVEDEIFQTPIKPGQTIITDFLELHTDGKLIEKRGYACDGPSGPTIDRKTNMRGAFGHDGLYQLIRLGFLNISTRAVADELLRQWWIQSGMWKWLANNEAAIVKKVANYAADPKNKKKTYEVF